MSTTYAGDPTNTPTSVTIPSDGDTKPVSSILAAIEGIMDLVRHALWPESNNTKKYPLASRSLTRVQASLPIRDLQASWTYIKNPGAYECQVNTAAELYHELDLPDGCTLTLVKCWLKGAPTDVALPATLPTMTIYKIDITANNTTTVGSATCSPGNLATYQGFNGVVLSGLTEVIDKTKYRYIAVFTSEAGANANAGLRYFGCQCVMTVTSQDPGAA